MGEPLRHEINQSTEFGGFWIRVGASLIDIVLLTIPLFIIDQFYLAGTPFLVDLLSASMWWLYYALLHSSPWQASIGKKLLMLKVVTVKGDRVSFARATLRFFSEIISVLLLGLGLMMIGWGGKKEGLHDIIAGTLVIKTKHKIDW